MAKTKDPREPKPGSFGAWLKETGDKDGVDLVTMLEKMSAGDAKARDAVAAFLHRRPEVAELVVERASTAESAWLDYAASDKFSRLTLEVRTEKVRRQLLGDNPTPLERLLVERIAICSLQVQLAETQFIGVMRGSATFAKARFYEDLQDRAQRRYLAAIKALAQIRRLQLPAVAQLNVATNQVNLSQPAGAPSALPAERPAHALGDAGAMTVDDVLHGPEKEHVTRGQSEGPGTLWSESGQDRGP